MLFPLKQTLEGYGVETVYKLKPEEKISEINPMRTHDSIPNEADQQLRESGKINNIISFNAQGRAGKTTLAKRLVEAKSGSDTESYIYVLVHTLRDNFKKKIL